MIRFCTKLVVVALLTATFCLSHTAVAGPGSLQMVEKQCIDFNGSVNIGDFSLDGKYVLTASTRDLKVKVFGHDDKGDWMENNTFTHNADITSAIFSPDGLNILSVSENLETSDTEVNIGGIDQSGKWTVIKTVIHENKLSSAIFSATGQYVLITSVDGYVIILEKDGSTRWSEKGRFVNKDHNNEEAEAYRAQITPDNNYLVTCDDDGCVKIRAKDENGNWNEKTVAEVKPGDDFYIYESILISHNSRYVVANITDNEPVILAQGDDGNGNWSQATNVFGTDKHSQIFFSPDGQYALTIGSEMARIWGLNDDNTWTIKGDVGLAGKVSSAMFSLNNQHALIIDESGCRVQILGRVEDETWELRGATSHEKVIIKAIFSDDSQHVAIAADDQTAKILSQCEDGSWKLEVTLPHDNRVYLVNFSHNNQRVLTVGEDYRTKIWEKDGSDNWRELASVSQQKDKCLYNLAMFGQNFNNVLTCSAGSLNCAQIWMLESDNDSNASQSAVTETRSPVTGRSSIKKPSSSSSTCTIL